VKLRNAVFAAALAALAHVPPAFAQSWGYGPYGPPMGYPPMPNYQSTQPTQILQNALERLKAFFSGEQVPPAPVIARFVDEQIAPYFDFQGMAEWIARPYYERMSPAQRAELEQKVKEAFLGILARELGAFAKPQPQVSFYRARPAGRGQIEVPARVLPANGYPIRLTFRFRQGEDGWKIIDVSSNGLSAVQYLRQQFIQMIRGYVTPRGPYGAGPGYRAPAAAPYASPVTPRP